MSIVFYGGMANRLAKIERALAWLFEDVKNGKPSKG